jgi:5-methyltetrahydrofolate--homocysteine methyltransferase
MLIVGEQINGTRKKVGEAILARDARFIQELALAQVKAGVHRLDVNAGTQPEREPEDMRWLVETIQEASDVPLCLDSPNPEALRAGLEVAKSQTMLNSTTAESERAQMIVPLAAKYGCLLIGLTIADSGMPSTAFGRVEIAAQIVDQAKNAGISEGDVYIDPLVRSVATEPEQGRALLEATRLIKEQFPAVHVIYGLSNISFGLPARSLMNRTLLAMAMACGLDAAIINPTDKQMMAVLRASEALLGSDEFCGNYLSAFRSGILE